MNEELGLIETIGRGHKDIKIFGVTILPKTSSSWLGIRKFSSKISEDLYKFNTFRQFKTFETEESSKFKKNDVVNVKIGEYNNILSVDKIGHIGLIESWIRNTFFTGLILIIVLLVFLAYFNVKIDL